MATSRIRFTFNEDMGLGQTIKFRRKYNDGALVGDWNICTETWFTLRFGPNQVAIGSPTAIPGERSAINFAAALALDYGFPSPGNVGGAISINGNVVTLTQTIYWQFDLDFPVIINTNPDFVDIELLNYVGAIGSITGVTFLPATTNPVCTHYKVSIASSVLIPIYQLPDSTYVTDNTDNPIVFEHIRGQGFVSSMETATGQSFVLGYTAGQVPQTFNASQINVTSQWSPSGATVTVLIIQLINQLNTYEYSINGADYQAGNSFPGLTNGTYTIYVRDNFGCVKTAEIVVTEGGLSTPVTYMSESLPIRFAKRVNTGVCGPYLTDRDRLSYEEEAEDASLVYQFFHPVLNCETRELQFLSNFATPKVFVINSAGVESELAVFKRTNHIGIKDKRDAFKYSITGGKTGIYFVGGNTYDYDTDIENGTYLLNGGLPEWGKIGNYANFNGAWHQITGITYNEDFEVDVLVFDTIYTGTNLVIVSSIFNRQNFEVYESVFLGSQFPNEVVQIRVDHIDPNFTTVSYLSEFIDVDEAHPGTKSIRYWNDKNTDVFYRSGIKFQTRLPKLRTIPGDEGDQDVLKADDQSNLLSASLYETETFNWDSMPKGIYRMASKVLTHKFLYIDDDGFIKPGPFESELQGQTNLILLKTSLLRNNKPYTTNGVGVEPTLVDDYEVLEVPNLITPDADDFIEY